MSMRPSPIEPVPEETARIARAAFRKGNLLMRIRDEIGISYDDQMFASLYDARGQLAISPWRLALVTVFQFLENLSDRQAAEAVRSRIDLKYALILEHLHEPWSRHAASSAPTPPMSWRRCAASTAWNSSARRCVPPSTPLRLP